MRCKFSHWMLDLDNYLLFRSGEPVVLRPKALKLLSYLVMNPQRLIQREEILNKVWSGRCVCDESLTTCIKEIRKVLGDTGRQKKFIVTRHGLGYQFLPSVLIEDHRSENADLYYYEEKLQTG